MKLTNELLSALFHNGAMNARQAATFGLKFPLKRKWKAKLIGREISPAMYQELLDCKGARPKGMERKAWRKPCVSTEEPEIGKKIARAQRAICELDARFDMLMNSTP